MYVGSDGELKGRCTRSSLIYTNAKKAGEIIEKKIKNRRKDISFVGRKVFIFVISVLNYIFGILVHSFLCKPSVFESFPCNFLCFVISTRDTIEIEFLNEI